MRKFSITLIFLLLVGSSVLPFLPVIAQPTPAAIPAFKVGATGSEAGSWDGVVATAGFAGASYAPNCLESLVVWPADWSGDFDDLIPVLAESWTITYWPEEMNVNPDPFINRGGIRAIEFTLRSGVEFHDGSDFNATVAKWNMDRIMVMSGNITGSLSSTAVEASDWYKSRTSYWLPADVWAPFETATWNVSQFIGQPATYEGFGTSYEGWSYGHYPRIKNVTVTEDLASGGKVKVYFNDWSAILTYITDTSMISMDAYQSYFDIPIIGLGDDPSFPQPDVSAGYPSTGFRGHLIGTGPYRFIEHDDIVLQGGIMEKYDDWWNASAMEANGMFQAPELDLVTFGYDQNTERNLAMTTGTIDYATDSVGQALNYLDMIADPNINYVLGGYDPTRTFITLNCVNDTYWKTLADTGVNGSDPAGPIGDMSWLPDIDADGTINVDGIDRAMRKAVSYAFDYDTYINVVLGGRARRTGGFLPSENEYYNPSIPLAYRNLTIARQTLLDDPYWQTVCASKGLTAANLTNDDDWLWVAENDPIFVFNLMWDQATIDIANVFATSINPIGMKCGGPFGGPDPAWEILPDLYTAMFAWYAVPFFTYHGVPTVWPGMTSKATPALEYYYRSPGPFAPYTWTWFPFKAWYNIGFVYNSTVDKWLDRSWFANKTYYQELMDKLTTHFQTYEFSDIMISENMWGYAINKDWELPEGSLGFSFLRYLPEVAEDGGQPIPGYQTAAILVIASVTISGIVYSMKRKKKLA
jgi:ABC-type transport system substrate-binding protein